MRIAGGVLIIIAAVMNLMAGCGYVAGGAVAGALTEGTDAAGAGGNAVMFGYFKMALGALEIAAGVVLFVGTAAMLAKLTAVLEIVNVGLGAAVFVGVSIFSAFGILAAVLAFLGAQQIGAAAGGGGGGGDAAAPPPPAEEPPAPAAEG